MLIDENSQIFYLALTFDTVTKSQNILPVDLYSKSLLLYS
jgi:hypothetical protein